VSERQHRIRGRRLQRIRERHLTRYPFCVMCLAMDPPKYVKATEIDHIVALVNGGKDIESNRQGLCDEHHRYKTRRDLGYNTSAACDEYGHPLDPYHEWNRS